MKVGKVIGNLSLVRAHSSLIGKRFVLVVPSKLQSLLAIPSADCCPRGRACCHRSTGCPAMRVAMVGVSEGG